MVTMLYFEKVKDGMNTFQLKLLTIVLSLILSKMSVVVAYYSICLYLLSRLVTVFHLFPIYLQP